MPAARASMLVAFRFGVVTALAGWLGAQQTLTVGRGQQFVDIGAAIAASSPGDTLLLGASFTAMGEHTMPASIPHTLTIRSLPSPQAFILTSTITLPPGAQLHLQNIFFLWSNGPLKLVGGLVTCEGTFVGSPPQSIGFPSSTMPTLELQNTHAVLRRCGATGLTVVRDSDLAAVDCTFAGFAGNFGLEPTPGLAGIRSTLRVSQSTVTCGGSSAGATAGWAAQGVAMSAVSLNASACSLVDCTLTSAPFAEPTAVVDATSTLTFDRTVFTPGAGTGNGIVGVAQPATLCGATMPEQQLLLGATITPTFAAAPGSAVFAVATLQLAAPAPAPFVQPEHWGFVGPSVVLLGVHFTNASGLAPVPIAIPNNAAFANQGLWLMGVLATTTPFALSVPVGGVMH